MIFWTVQNPRNICNRAETSNLVSKRSKTKRGKKSFIPEPTTTNKKKPSTMGPTGGSESFFWKVKFSNKKKKKKKRMNSKCRRRCGETYCSRRFHKTSLVDVLMEFFTFLFEYSRSLKRTDINSTSNTRKSKE